jgi:nucleotide-binding universal stress UspA family protein
MMSAVDLSLYAQIEEARREEERQRAAVARLLPKASDRQRSGTVYRQILVALRGRKADEAVLNHVQALATRMKAQVTLLWVITIADDGGGGLGRQWQLEAGSSGWHRKNQAEAYLPQLERRLEQAGLGVEAVVVIGTRSEADEIVGYAAEHGCDLIAMASDPQPWYLRWLGRSPASDVQRKATVPTLFVGTSSRKVSVKRAAPKANRLMVFLGGPDL